MTRAEAEASGWTIVPGQMRKRFDPDTGQRLPDVVESPWIGENADGRKAANGTLEGLLITIEGLRPRALIEIAKREPRP
jgi:hypothetical protein